MTEKTRASLSRINGYDFPLCFPHELFNDFRNIFYYLIICKYVSPFRHNWLKKATVFFPDVRVDVNLNQFSCDKHFDLENTYQQWPVPLINLLNTATRMPFKNLFVMLVGSIIFPFVLGI